MFPEIELKEGWVTVVLLFLIFLCVAWAIQTAHWTEGLAILQGIVLMGGLIGIVLAKSRIPNRMAHLLSILAGFTWSIYLIGRFLAQTMDLPVSAAVVALDWRLQSWLTALINRGTSSDNYIFLLALSLLLWVMAYFSAWAIFRWQRVWWAVIVCGLALMLNNIYTLTGLTGYLIAFLFFALLLVVRANVAFHEQEWRVARVAYSSELVFSFLRAGLVISILAILLAWVTPKAVASRPFEAFWDKVGEPWRRFQDRSARVFQDLNYQNQPRYIYSDRSSRFGGAVKLSDTPIMDVESPVGRYWRVMAYHEYTGDGWNNTDTDTILIDENEQVLAVPEFDLRREITQTVILRQDLGPDGTIAAASQPLRAQLPLRAVVSLVTHEEDLARSRALYPRFAVPGDPSVLYSREPLKAGESYQVYSSLSVADAESLREAAVNYPDWVTPRYLQLPDSLPQRVRLLAEELTQGQGTPYDKAVAIERYLRNIPYNDQIAGPGLTQDGVDYFLFDAKQGYCEYYASAMVVMLRAVGVPARYVRGYSQGEREEDGLYHVREWDGHAWPEVFFPGYGWVEFEPTAGEPVLVRPSSRAETSQQNGDSEINPFPRRGANDIPDIDLYSDSQRRGFETVALPWWKKVGRGGWLAVDLGAMGLVLAALFRVRRMRYVAGMSVAERVYEDLLEWVRRLLHIDLLAHQTPHEYTTVVAQVVPQGRRAMEQIADCYVQERFGRKEIACESVEAAWKESWRAMWHRWGEQKTDTVRRIWHWLVPPKDLYPPENG
jgi:transglutaminase-like putative cysteine protease